MTAVPATRFSEQDLNDAIFATWIECNMGFAFNSIEEAIDMDEFPYGHEYDEFVEAVDEYGYDAPYSLSEK